MRFGIRIGHRDWGSEIGTGMGYWEWDCVLGLKLRIGIGNLALDWRLGLGFKIVNKYMGI